MNKQAAFNPARFSMLLDAVLLLLVVWVFSKTQPYIAIILFCLHVLTWSQLMKGLGLVGLKAARATLLRKATSLALMMFYVCAALVGSLSLGVRSETIEVTYDSLLQYMKWQGLPYVVVLGLITAVMIMGLFSERKPPR
jgi:hypothetical protein